MSAYIVRRIVQSLVLLFFISALIYVVLNLVPGGPFDMLRLNNPRITPSMIDRLNKLLDLDKPLLPGKYCPVEKGEVLACRADPGRYVRWLGKVVQGDFGKSWTMQTGVPVLTMIGQRLWYTLLLTGLALLVALIIALPIGIYSAVKQYSVADYAVTAFAFFGQAMPTFWTGLMVVAIFAVGLRWFPTGGVRAVATQGDIVEALGRVFSFGKLYPQLAGQEGTLILDGLRHLALPVLILAFFQLATWSRYTRTAMLEVLRQDYMRTARAKGLSEKVVILKHGLRNALIPLITILALTIPGLIGGAIITETIFSWPGMGLMTINAIAGADWPVVQGLLIIQAFLVVFCNLLGDVLYAVVDPRIQYA